MQAIGFLICLLNLMLSFYMYRNLISPNVMLSLVWAFCYGVQIMFTKPSNSILYLFFSFGVVIFNIGFILSSKYVTYTFQKKLVVNKIPYSIKHKQFLNIIFYIVILIFVFYFFQLISLVSNNYMFNIWQSISIAKAQDIYSEPVLIGYGRIMVLCFTLFCWYIYLNNEKIISLFKLLVLLIISSIFVFTAGNRGMIFLFLIALFVSFIYVKNVDNRTILILLFILFFSILFIFYITTFLKFVFEDQSTDTFLIDKFKSYFALSMPAFINWNDSIFDYSYGGNTFSFIKKILFNIGVSETLPPPLIQDFTYIEGGVTNVYTIHQYYTRDFGLIYALFIQFLLGNVYGYLYQVENQNSYYHSRDTIFLSFLYFPLINQFFDDKYFSIFSTWLQIFIWLSIFNLFFIRKDSNINE